MKNKKIIYWVVLLVVLLVLGFLKFSKEKNSLPSNANGKKTKAYAVLTLDSSTKSFSVGDTFMVSVTLDTDGKPVDGVDVYSLHYDPKILSVVDDMPNTSGVQVSPGTAFGISAMNLVDTTTGSISFSQVSNGGTSFKGKGVIAKINFKAIAPGKVELKFDFKPGNTIDTNAAYHGEDMLTAATGATYTISPK